VKNGTGGDADADPNVPNAGRDLEEDDNDNDGVIMKTRITIEEEMNDLEFERSR
jgi:hypothetical protein